MPLFGVEHRGAADRTEAKPESRTLIAGTYVFRGRARDVERRRETRERREHAAGAPLAGEAMADANAARLTVHFNAQLAAGAGCCS